MAGKKQGKKPRGKFTEQQRDFLLSKVPEFREAQQNINTPPFFSALYVEWFTRWPIANDGSQADSEASSPDNPGVKTPREEMMARIKNWFYNSRVGKTRKGDRAVVLDLTKGTRRVLQPYQAYMKLYKDKLRPTVRERYQQQLQAVREGTKPPDRLTILIDTAMEFLEMETPEVKAEIEQFRLHGDTDESLDEKEKARRNAILGLPKTIQRAAENVEKETGWVMSVMLGGIDPDSGGILSYVFHNGKTYDTEETWDDFEPGWDEIEDSFNQFLTHCFPQKVERPKLLNLGKGRDTTGVKVQRLDSEKPGRRSTSLPSDVDADPNARGDEEEDLPSDPSSRGSSPEHIDPPPSPSPSPSPNTNNPQTPQNHCDPPLPSSSRQGIARELTFDEQRDEQISRNKRMIEELGLNKVVFGKPRPPPRRPKEPNPVIGEEQSSGNDVSPEGRPSPGKSISASDNLTTLTNKRTHSSTAPSPQPRSTSSSTSTSFLGGSSGSHLPTVVNGSGSTAVTVTGASTGHDHVADVVVRPSHPSSSPTPSTAANRTIPPPNDATAVHSSCTLSTPWNREDTHDGSHPLAHQESSSLSSNPVPPSSTPTITRNSNGTDGTSAAPPDSPSHPSGTSPSPPITVTIPAEGAGNNSAPASSGLSSSPGHTTAPDMMEDIQPTLPDAPFANPSFMNTPSPSTFLHVSTRALPQSLPDTIRAASSYMLALSSNETWHHLVINWVLLEEALGYPNNKPRLPTTNRPEEVGQFIRGCRQYSKAPVLPASKLRPYAAMWKGWWTTMQPQWRGVDEWPFSREDTNCDWSPLLQGGVNGLYLVVISLGWWILAAWKVNEEKPAEWTQVIDVLRDVDWVFERLLLQARRAPSPPVIVDQ